MTAFDPAPLIARELSCPLPGVRAALALFSDGNTLPFIARYRKEATGGLDEVALRGVEERAAYLGELDARRQTILGSVEEQGKLTPALRQKIEAATTKTDLEDLYRPYKPKRRTRATIARERGLEALAARVLAQPRAGRPEEAARAFVDPEKEIPDVAAALAGARDIVAEQVADDPELRAVARVAYQRRGRLVSKKSRKAPEGRTRFEDWYGYEEPLARVPSHRYLAMRRGEAEGVLSLSLAVEEERLLPQLAIRAGHDGRSPFAGELEAAIADGFKRLMAPSLETDIHQEHKARADGVAIDVFATNLRQLLLEAPFGQRPVIGIDPGLRTGCKCAALNATGRFEAHQTIYPHTGDEARAARDLVALVRRHRPDALAVGNGTAGRETEAFARRALAEAGLGDVIVALVSEAGASVYSASEVARAEFPELDLTVRGAISIGRRLQDPLAELVKIDPKSIGVGQYQHDVDQKRLTARLEKEVASAVNQVGVELNTASAPLLAHVAGVGPRLAERVVAHRDAHGPFAARGDLLDVKGLGPKAYEQAAGFLRIRGGRDPLDASAVHPERYALVARMARDLGVTRAALIDDADLAARIDPARYLSQDVGAPTLADILAELAKPGRDPRDTFTAPAFRDDVREISDLEPGMTLEGVVTNVTHFGAFVDIGVHQDGLVHVSQLADRFVRDPAEVAHVGQRLKVRVLDVDLERKRISLSAKGTGCPATSSAPACTAARRRSA
jgi:protein Tex